MGFDVEQIELGDTSGNKVKVLLYDNKTKSLDEWIVSHRSELRNFLAKEGVVVFRGWPYRDTVTLEAVISVCLDMEWKGLPQIFTTRHAVGEKVFTSTDYPRTHTIALHSEFSHSPFQCVPKYLYFSCEIPAEQGGATPICDIAEVYDQLDTAVREEFIRKKVKYYRIFTKSDVDWRTVFQTQDPKQVEELCRKNKIQWQWKDNGDSLHASWVLPATRTRGDGREVWFNQANVVAFAALPNVAQEHFVRLYGEHVRPLDVSFADDTPITKAALDHINMVFNRLHQYWSWCRGDIMIVENLKMSHGRQPFGGERRVLVGMSDPVEL